MTSKSSKILVVDDEQSIRENLTAFLLDEGFDVEAADSAEMALLMLQQAPYDIGIIDMRLPLLDGNALILMAAELRPAMRFLIHTGSTTYTLPANLQALGLQPEHIIRKPLSDMRELLNVIAAITLGRG